MSEVVVIEAQKPTSIFHVSLDIPHLDIDRDPSNDEDNDTDKGAEPNLSRESWKLQLLRLVQEAPKPIPVFCSEPRQFPHLGINKRISESSWASDSTCSTEVTGSDSASLTALEGGTKGGNENEDWEWEESALSPPACKYQYQQPSFPTGEWNNADDPIPICPSRETNGKMLETRANYKRDNQEDMKGLDTLPQKHMNLSRGKGKNPAIPQGHPQVVVAEVKGNDDGNGKRNRQATLSLSIQGDSEYWKKFRHSKDYQSSLMIETICNEVFNLRPSLRYKNLMKLSQRKKAGLRNKRENGGNREEESSPQQSVIESSNDKDDEKGIKVETTDKQREEEDVKTKEKVQTISTRQSHHAAVESEEKRDEVRSGGSNKAFSSFHQQQERRNNEEDDDGGPSVALAGVCGGGGGNGTPSSEKEHGRPDGIGYQGGERKQSHISTTSSVFTVTTSGDGEDENFNECRSVGRVGRMLISEGFGSLFHGYLTKVETENLLRTKGQYLIRQVWMEDGFILSFRFDGEVLNYRITCEVGSPTAATSAKHNSSGDDDNHSSENFSKCRYYLENRRKCYSSLDELVTEGLLTLHLEENAGSYIDLLVELAQFQRSDSLLQTPAAATPGSRKTSRAASFRATRIPSSCSSTLPGGNGVDDEGRNSSSSLTATGRNSMDIALLIHFFEDETFRELAKCQICSNGLGGPSSCKGLRCRDCGLAVHESCIDNIKNECKPDLRTISPFSTDLTTLVKGSCSTTGGGGSYGLPYILEKCINELEVRGIGTEGIYRISGSVAELEDLKNLFERERINTDLSGCPDIHSITGLVKYFFRQLPDPLITPEVFEEYVRDGAGEMTTTTVQSLLLCLPPAHRLTLKYFLNHLKRVTEEKAENKMSAFNLSSILLPSMIGPSNMSFDVLETGAKLLYFLITHADQLKY